MKNDMMKRGGATRVPERQIHLVAADGDWQTAVAAALEVPVTQLVCADALPAPDALPDDVVLLVVQAQVSDANQQAALAAVSAAMPVVVLLPDGLETAVDHWVPALAHDYICRSDLSPALMRQALRHACTLFSSQQQLRQAQAAVDYAAMFTAVWETANDAMALSDDKGIVFAANKAYLALYGLDEAEVLGQSFARIFEAAEVAKAEVQYRAIFQLPDPPAAYESEVVGKDNSRRIVESRIGFIEQDGQRVAMVSVIRDITERRQREIFANEMADRIPALIVVRDKSSGRLTYVNEMVKTMMGYEKETLLALSAAEYQQLIHPDDREKVVEHVAHTGTLADGEFTSVVFRFCDADGAYRTLYSDAAVLSRDDYGSPLTIVAVINDITQQDAAEKALRSSEARMRAVLESATALTIIVDKDYTILSVSGQIPMAVPNWQDALIGYNVLDLILDPDLRQQGQEMLPAVFAGENWDAFVSQEGFSWYCRLSPLRDVAAETDAGAAVDHIIIVAVDVTEQQRISQNLQGRETFIRRIAEALPAILYVYSQLEERNIYANQEIAEVLGYDVDEVQAMGERLLQDLLHPDDWAETKAATMKLAQSEPGTVVDREYRMLHRDGSYRWLMGREVGLTWTADGRLDQVLGVVYDNTERRQEAEVLRQLSHVVEQSPVSVVVTDTDGAIVYVNARFEEMTQYTREEVLGKTPRILKSGEQPQEFYEVLWQTILAGEKWRGEVVNRRKDGTTYWESMVISPIVDGAGNVTHFAAIKEDITEQRQIQQETQQHERLAAVGQLAAGIAHDFNNILAVITLYTQLVHETADLDVKARGRLDTVLHQSERAAHLIQQILDFSRRAVVDRQPLNLAKVVQETIDLLQRTLPKNIVIQSDIQAGNLLQVKADATRMQQLVMNLCVNARDAMPDGGVLSIVMRRQVLQPDADGQMERPLVGMSAGDWIELHITDNGIGMPADVQPRIFDPFYTTKAPGKGTGLGLSQVYGIVKQHNGFIDVSSRPGKDTTFSIYLPAMPVTAAADGNSKVLPVSAGGGETVLLVEDDPLTRQALIDSLEMLGYTVIVAVDGNEAFQIVQRQSAAIDLILTDYMMPNVDGRQLLEMLHAAGNVLPVVILTGHIMEMDLQDLRQFGLVDWVMKPIQLTQLSETLTGVLHAR